MAITPREVYVAQEESVRPMPLDEIESCLRSLIALGDTGPVRVVETAIAEAVRHRCSDIYVEPRRACSLLRYRIDGTLHDVAVLPKQAHERLIARIKVMAKLPVYQRGIPMDGRIDGNVVWDQHGLRVATLPTVEGEKAVLRIVNRDRGPLSLGSLGFCPTVVATLRKIIDRPQGVVFLTGPSSSGKTTTIYALLAGLLERGNRNHIVTIEDPVEYRLDGICQTEVNAEIGYDYSAALRAILRQDPEVIVIGEVRDTPTAHTAVQAGLTGHLVLSTIHSGTAAGVFSRLLDMGLEPYLVASAVNAALAQRLVRRSCTACAKPYTPTEDLVVRFGLEAESLVFRRGGGCPLCNNVGYRGRTGIAELLKMNDVVTDHILARRPTRVIHDAAVEAGMTSLVHDGLDRVRRGITTLEELGLAIASPQPD